MDIKDLDINFLSGSKLRTENVKIYDVLNEPFEVFGVLPPENDDDVYHRFSYQEVGNFFKNLSRLHLHTSGGKIKFRTNSNYIGIYAELGDVNEAIHMAPSGYMGFDLYTREDDKSYWHAFTFLPTTRDDRVITGGIEFADYYDECPEHLYDKSLTVWPLEAGKDKTRDFLINMPLYSGVKKIYVVLSDDATVEKATPFENELPVVVYGNSLTQGACASRPGLSWTNMIAQRHNLDIINLGFSGSAKGEEGIARYFADKKMSVFVSDYDWNSSDDVDLRANLKRMIEIIREKQPFLPIICLSRPLFIERQTSARRRKAIFEIVEERKAKGDENIYFVDGREVGKIFGCYDALTVEGWHLSDVGMFCEAEVVGKKLLEILKTKK